VTTELCDLFNKSCTNTYFSYYAGSRKEKGYLFFFRPSGQTSLWKTFSTRKC